MTTPAPTTSPADHTRFIFQGPSCANSDTKDELLLMHFHRFLVAEDEKIQIVCGLACIDADECSAFGFDTSKCECVLFKYVTVLPEDYVLPQVSKCYLKDW